MLSRADAALSELSGVGRLLTNPHLLIAPWMAREAILSSRIEGTRTTLSELLIDEAGGARVAGRAAADLQEVRNYVDALEYGVERLPLSLRLVRELHARLMKGLRGDKATPGELRRSQNWIGPQGSTPANAAYVPPPVSEMPVRAGARAIRGDPSAAGSLSRCFTFGLYRRAPQGLLRASAALAHAWRLERMDPLFPHRG